MTPDTAPEAITQADREAAADLIAAYWRTGDREGAQMQKLAQSYRDGHTQGVWAAAFARHRRFASQDAGEGLREALEPWVDHHGPLPDFDSPFACVFDSGVQHTVELLAKELKVDDWTPCDGTEEYDGDLGGTLMNIVRAAMPEDAYGERMWPHEVRALLTRPSDAGSTTPSGGEAAITAMARAMCDRVNGQGDFDENIEQRRSGWEAQARTAYEALATTPSPDASPDSGEREVDALASTYAAEYVISREGADYEPTDWERELIEDALHGFIAEHRLSPSPSPAIVKEAGEVEAAGKAVEAEREACAVEAEADYTPGYGPNNGAQEWLANRIRTGIAERIRARAALSASNAAQVSK